MCIFTIFIVLLTALQLDIGDSVSAEGEGGEIGLDLVKIMLLVGNKYLRVAVQLACSVDVYRYRFV